MLESGWYKVGRGIVADDPIKGNSYLLIHPIELITYNGVITPEKDKKKNNGANKAVTGIVNSLSSQPSPILKAKWKGDPSGNRVTPPAIKKGSSVILYRNSDTNEYVWEVDQYEADLRKKEYSTWVWSNLKHGKEDHDKIPNNENSTYVVVDNEAGELKLHTPNNDKEKASLDFHVNMKEGVLTIDSDRGYKITYNFNTGEFSTNSGVFVFNNPVIFNGTTNFKGASNFNAAVTMNGNAKTADGSTVL